MLLVGYGESGPDDAYMKMRPDGNDGPALDPQHQYTGPQKWWKLRNSWGDDYGEGGYARISRGTDYCQVTSMGTYGNRRHEVEELVITAMTYVK